MTMNDAPLPEPMIPEGIHVNSPFWAIAAALLTVAYPLLAMLRLSRQGKRSGWKSFIRGAQMGAICAFLVQDFFCTLLVAFQRQSFQVQPDSIVAYNPGFMSVVLPSVMLLTIPFIRSSVWLGVISASMVQQCVRLLLVVLIRAPVRAADPTVSTLGVGDFYRTELLLGAAFIPIALCLVARMYEAEEEYRQSTDDDDEEEDDGCEAAVAQACLTHRYHALSSEKDHDVECARTRKDAAKPLLQDHVAATTL